MSSKSFAGSGWLRLRPLNTLNPGENPTWAPFKVRRGFVVETDQSSVEQSRSARQQFARFGLMGELWFSDKKSSTTTPLTEG